MKDTAQYVPISESNYISLDKAIAALEKLDKARGAFFEWKEWVSQGRPMKMITGQPDAYFIELMTSILEEKE